MMAGAECPRNMEAMAATYWLYERQGDGGDSPWRPLDERAERR
jgi:hypothetical protein